MFPQFRQGGKEVKLSASDTVNHNQYMRVVMVGYPADKVAFQFVFKTENVMLCQAVPKDFRVFFICRNNDILSRT